MLADTSTDLAHQKPDTSSLPGSAPNRLPAHEHSSGPMYLVELKPGKEELYRSSDDLAIAIREGEVDARSRIYHRVTAKWISITLHPQYKAIVAGQDGEAPARRKVWGLLPSGIPVELSSAEGPTVTGTIRQRWKRPIGFGVAGILLLLGIQLSSRGPRPPWADQRKPVAIATARTQSSARLQIPPTEVRDEPEMDRPEDYDLDIVSFASTTSPAWPAHTASLDTSAAPLPRAPRLRSKALRAALTVTEPVEPVNDRSVHGLLARYEAASDEAYTRLQAGIRVARLDRLFGPGRLTPGGGVPHTRLSLAGAANFIRVYRQEQAGIEKVYQDSVSLMTKRYRWKQKEVRPWYTRTLRKENPSLVLLSSSLLGGIDSILGVLDSYAGAYKIRGGAIAFEDPAATHAYGALRKRVKEQIDAAVAGGGATSLGPTGLLLQAIGTSTLPRET